MKNATQMAVGGRRPRRQESVAFVSCAAIIALNIVIDSLIALHPGARLADHVPAVLVPLVVLVAAAVLYPRLRPGLRGGAGLFIGVLALIWAGITIAEARLAGFRAEHITGFLLLPAGVTLVAIGLSVLATTRKQGKWRYVRRAGWVLVALLVGYWVVLPIGIAAYATHRPQTPVAQMPTGVDYEDVAVETCDGVRLHGWYIPSRNGAAMITYPREWTIEQARMLASQGYGVLLLDMRGYGDSEGDPNAFGWGCTRDIDAGVAFLLSRDDVDVARIGGFGLSVGAEQMIEAAASNPALRAIVAEGAGERSVRESLIRGPKGYFAVPMMAVQTVATAVLSGRSVPPALDELAARISPRALLLIHAENGGGGEELTPDYYAAAGDPKSIWMVAQGGHTAGLSEHPREYSERVGAFLAQNLLQ